MISEAIEVIGMTTPRIREAPIGEGAEGIMCDLPPLGYDAALRALVGCAASTARLLFERRVHLPRSQVGRKLAFADGTSAPVYRETVVDSGPLTDPCVLVVEFRLRAVRGRGHTLFRWESILNTPLFVGFPGYVSKLWLAHDERGRYRGIYQWDGRLRADGYARALWRVLALVSARGSIHYVVLPGQHRDALLDEAPMLDGAGGGAADDWWRPVSALSDKFLSGTSSRPCQQAGASRSLEAPAPG